MKKYILLLLGCASLVMYSCRKDKEAAAPQQQRPGKIDYQFANFQKFIPKPIQLQMLTEEQFQAIVNRSKRNTTSIDRVVTNPDGSRTYYLSSDEIPALTVKDRTTTYIGALLQGNSIDDMTLKPIQGVQQRPISVYADFPTDFVQDSIKVPSGSSQQAFVRKALLRGTGDQISSFTYDMQRFYRSDELKLSFGANVNIGKIFSASVQSWDSSSNKRTRIRAMFVQKNFSINMDPPADGKVIEGSVDPSRFGGYAPLIVSNVNFGRMGIITIESTDTYEATNLAVKAAFNVGIVGGGANLTSDQLHLLQAATIQSYIIGADGTDAVRTISGFDGFSELILKGGKFSATNPGVPISFDLRYVSDFSPYATQFQLLLPPN
ncbi:thiol-activated cytolysin family protein [Chitinophaga vietnamensis]|uniref:thiol-activated cytolysin family protein n=1 Tax=Chitinophaga vietnamensis TaxID=2593957 RepID=UPI001178427B|nr:thiol-activated cytolysin family protein [Chitinophaga vietnamensis]